MTRIKKVGIVGIIVFILIGVFVLIFVKNYPYRKFEKEISKKFTNDETAYPETYDSLCNVEYTNNISFPKIQPDYAIMHFDKFLKRNIRLTSKQLNKILVFLNDSSNYCWGELGTPYFDRFITFHNKNRECIGLTKIDFGGQTYSSPHLSLMKWGLINPSSNKMNDIIKEIEAN